MAASALSSGVTADTIPSYPIGQDQFLAVGAAYGTTYACEGFQCTLTSSAAHVSGQLGEPGGTAQPEQSIGWRFNFHRVCDGQSAAAPFTMRYNYTYTFSPNVPLLVQGAVTHDVRARSFADQSTGIVSAPALLSTGSGTLVNTNVPVSTSTTYEASVSTRPTLQMTDNPAVPGEAVSVTSSASAVDLALDFTDPLAPEFVTKTTDPAPVNGDGGNFLGYVNTEPVHFRVRARDPAVSASGNNVIQSCVRDITLLRGGQANTTDPGFAQVEVRSGPFTGQGQHDTTAIARDWQNNQRSETLNFILDSVPPVTTIDAAPAAPTGNNGWYKAPQPSWVVQCQHDPNSIGAAQTAPCLTTNVSSDGGGTWVPLGPESAYTLPIPEGFDRQLRALSRDAALNVGTLATSPILDVDYTNPLAAVQASTVSEFDNGWYKTPTTLTISCAYDATSGCIPVTSSTDGSTFFPTSSYGCSEETDIPRIDWRVEDAAGNRVIGHRRFGCDFTPPRVVETPRLTSPVFRNPHLNTTYANVTPSWAWNDSGDPLSNGVASGVLHWEVRLNGVTSIATAPAFSPAPGSVPEGVNCVRVRAVDQAGNRGIFSELSCIFVDSIVPAIQWGLPLPGSLYHNGNRIVIPHPLPAPNEAVVVGDITTGVTATDVGTSSTASKMYNVELVQDRSPYYAPVEGAYRGPAYCEDVAAAGQDIRRENDCDPTCEDVNALAVTCEWHDDESDDGAGVYTRRMFARAWDNANNRQIAWRNYVKLDLALVENTCTGLTGTYCNQLLWASLKNPQGFQAFIIERLSPEDPADPLAPDAWTPIANIPVATATSFTDLLATKDGVRYDYRVRIEVQDALPRFLNNVWIVAQHDGLRLGEWPQE